MGLDITVKTEIARNREDIAQYALEPENDPVWVGGISEAELLTERPIGHGTRVRRVAKFLGKEIHYILEVSDYIPGRLMVMQSVQSPFPMTVTYRFEDAVHGSVAEIRVEGTSEGFYKLADILMAPQVRRSLRGDLKRLKTIMENKLDQ